MTTTQIEKVCIAKENELIDKYFGNLVKEAIEKTENIGKYDLDLPATVEQEYVAFLKELWTEAKQNDGRMFFDIIDNRHRSEQLTENKRETMNQAYNEAVRITLWERLTKTNHEDVTNYKGILKDYTSALLKEIRCDFLEDVGAAKYIPQPISTSDVILPAAMNQLVEQLARNVHDNWALGRIKEGWTYGPQRDDANKKHPCLVDYDELPENEKEYDRNTAMETVKLILKLGWKIDEK